MERTRWAGGSGIGEDGKSQEEDDGFRKHDEGDRFREDNEGD